MTRHYAPPQPGVDKPYRTYAEYLRHPRFLAVRQLVFERASPSVTPATARYTERPTDVSYLLIQTSNRERTPRPAAVPSIVGPFSTEEDAEQYAADHHMGQGHDEYGGCLSVCVVWNDLTVRAPAEFAEMLDEGAN